jgi:hypothetical protein
MIRNPQQTNALTGPKVAEWKQLGDLALAELVVSPERAREITEKLYPESEMRGRPGLFAPRESVRKTDTVSEADGPIEPDEERIHFADGVAGPEEVEDFELATAA